jgi:hypothetical protein
MTAHGCICACVGGHDELRLRSESEPKRDDVCLAHIPDALHTPDERCARMRRHNVNPPMLARGAAVMVPGVLPRW